MFARFNKWYWGLCLSIAVAAFFAERMAGKNQGVFLPGQMSLGHHQIEMDCEACHTPFLGVTQKACLDCHGDELQDTADSHSANIENAGLVCYVYLNFEFEIGSDISGGREMPENLINELI